MKQMRHQINVLFAMAASFIFAASIEVSVGVTYERDPFGFIQRSTADFQDPHSGSVKKVDGGAEWRGKSRMEKFPGTGFTLTEFNERTWNFDTEGRLISAETDRGDQAIQVKEDRNYIKGRADARSLKISKKGADGGLELKDAYRHDDLGELRVHSFDSGGLEFERDVYGKLKTWKGHAARKVGNTLKLEHQNTLTLQYTHGEVSNISDARGALIEGIYYDSLGRMSRIDYAQGLSLIRTYQGHSTRPQSVELRAGDRILFSEVLTEDHTTHEIVGRTLISELLQENENFKYNPKTYHLIKPKQPELDRESGKITNFGTHVMNWSGEELTQFNQTLLFYDSDGSPRYACEVGSNQGCARFANADVYEKSEVLYALHRVGDLPALLTVGDQSYLVVADHLGSVRALVKLDPTSKEAPKLEFVRHYSAWGLKKVAAKDEVASELERNVLFSFATLREAPGLRSQPGAPLYLSRSNRVYSSELKEWMSADKAVQWEPERLVRQPGNWHAVRYAGNRPLEFVDPSGKVVVKAALDFGVHIGEFGGSVSIGGAVGYSVEKGWSIGVSMASLGGAGIGLDVGMGLGISISNEKEVSTGKSLVRTFGVSGAFGQKAGIEVSQNVSLNDGSSSLGFGASLGAGAGLKAYHYTGIELGYGMSLDEANEFFELGADKIKSRFGESNKGTFSNWKSSGPSCVSDHSNSDRFGGEKNSSYADKEENFDNLSIDNSNEPILN